MFFTPPPQNHNLLVGTLDWQFPQCSDKMRCSSGPTFSFHQKKLENPELMRLGVFVALIESESL